MTQKFTRNPWVVSLAAGATENLPLNADYWYVHSILNAGAVAQEIEMAVNDSNSFAKVRSGAGGQGDPGRGDMKRLQFRNTTGAAVTVIVIYGNGIGLPGITSVQSGGTLDLSTASIAALSAAIAAATSTVETADPNEETVVNGDPTRTFSGMCGITIFNTGSAVIEYRKSGGSWKSLAVGDNTGWSATGKYQIIGPVEVRCPNVGGEADVVFTGGAMA